MANVLQFEIEILFGWSEIFRRKTVSNVNSFDLIQARAYQALDYLKKNDAPNALKSAEEASKGKKRNFN